MARSAAALTLQALMAPLVMQVVKCINKDISMVQMRVSMFQKTMIERGMKGYDSAFISGVIAFLFSLLSKHSFTTSATLAVYFWLMSVVIFICYHFEIGGDYYRKAKQVTNPKGNKIYNLALGVLYIYLLTFVPLLIAAGTIIGATKFLI